MSSMANLNYAVEYSRALANAYPKVLHFGKLYNVENDTRYRWLNADTIEIPTMSTTGRVAADRDSVSTASRNYTNNWEPKKLSFERKWSTLVHPRDVEETNLVTTISNITQTFNETQKFPEKDSYLVSKIFADYDKATRTGSEGSYVHKYDTTTISKDNILATFDGYMEAMDDAGVPASGRLFYCTYAVKTMLKQAAGISRSWDTQTSADGLNRKVDYLDGVEIIGVPASIMKTAFDFTTGAVPAVGAKQINVFMVHPSAIITPETYEYAKLDAPSAGSEGKYVYYEEAHEDAFILNQRTPAIIFNITDAQVSA